MSRLKFICAIWLAIWLVSGVSFAIAGTQMEDLENALMCKCDDKCGKVMVNCTCDTAKETRKDFQRKLASGLTVNQIIQTYVDKYGETVLSAPTKRGFNLTAWITPFLALVVGGIGVRQIIRAWARRSGESGPSGEGAEAGKTKDVPADERHNKLNQRLQSELDKLEY